MKIKLTVVKKCGWFSRDHTNEFKNLAGQVEQTKRRSKGRRACKCLPSTLHNNETGNLQFTKTPCQIQNTQIQSNLSHPGGQDKHYIVATIASAHTWHLIHWLGSIGIFLDHLWLKHIWAKLSDTGNMIFGNQLPLKSCCCNCRVRCLL